MSSAIARGNPNDRLDSNIWRIALASSGALLVLLAIIILLAWAFGFLEYVQIDPALPPPHYNAAIGFLAWGAAYLALAAGRFETARRIAIGLFGGSAILTLNLIPGVHLGIDRWAFDVSQFAGRFGPSGVMPGMVLGLVLAGIAVLLAARRDVTAFQSLICTLIGGVLVIGSPVALVMAYTGNSALRLPGPAILGGLGATVAGLGAIASAFRRGTPTFTIGRALPLTVAASGIVLTFVLWAGLNTEQGRRLHRQVQFEAAHVQHAAQERLQEEAREVAEKAERWIRYTPDEARADIKSYVDTRPSCLGIARIDTGPDVTWIETRTPQPLPDTIAELGLGDSLRKAVREGKPVVIRAPRSFWHGRRVLVFFAPHGALPLAPGGLISVYRCQDLLEMAVNANVAAGYAVTITENDETLFARLGGDERYRGEWGQILAMGFDGFNWRLSVWPTRDALERESLSLPRLALVIGLFTTALLALAVHLAQTARRRTFALENEIRERKLAEQAMKQSEEKYRSLIENLGQGIFLQDRDHRYVAANAEFCRNIGRTEREIIGATDADLFESRRASTHAEEIAAVLAEGKSVESEEDVEVDNQPRQVRRVLTPVRDATGRTTGVLGICWDVTEQRRLEAHVHQASKMDAIGQLAGGIAHDFNNLLTVILGNLDMVLGSLPESHACREPVTASQNAASRAASLTQRLLGFSRRHKLDWVAADLNAVVNEVVALLSRTIDPLIRIETTFAEELWPVHADPAQLNQVLMNLCLNARDAIDGAGRITIETTCVREADLPVSCGAARRTGEFVRLRVTDSGSGMTPDVKARIFEPFFTTKEVGKGTGLGLPMVFAIIRQHRGWIDCWSEPGRGTRFDIYLPRGEAAKAAAVTEALAVPRRHGKETVLVVDDEEMIRTLAGAALRSRGYTVLEAEDGQQALDIYSRELDRIDLVILDLTMPTLSGHEAFRHLLNLNARVRVLFASGYAVEQLSDLEKEMMAGFVKKPYRPNELILAVEEALQKGGSEPVAAGDTPLPFLHPSGVFRMPVASA